MTTGFERGDFSGIVGVELLDKRPLWGFERDIQDSTLDAPTSRRRLPRLTAQILNWEDDTNIAPADDCAAMSGLNEGDRLEFDIEVDRRGKYSAVNLVPRQD